MITLDKYLTADIDDIIETYKKEPWIYDSNVYRAYGACKRVIYEAEKNKVIPWDCKLYDKYIEYITEKLGI